MTSGHRLTYASLAAAVALLAVSTPAAAGSQEAHAVPFIAVAKDALPDRDWEHKVCALASARCGTTSQQDDSVKEPSLFRVKGDAPGGYYAILPGPLLLQASFASDTGWTITQKWDFSDYEPEDRVTGDGDSPPLELYPALYPVGDERFAVAVLARWTEGYAGGGGSWTNADFVELEPNGKHASTPRVSRLPFSCAKSIRACFSESDYKHFTHCSDDFNGSLRLHFEPGATAGKLDWIATWKETHWPGREPKSKTEHTSTSVKLPASQNSAAAGDSLRAQVPFCEPIN